MTPFHSCNEAGKPSAYTLNIKEWIIVYFLISIVQLCKFFLFSNMQQQVDRGRMTYMLRTKLKVLVHVLQEGMHFGWQIYGNFIFFENRVLDPYSLSEEQKFNNCMSTKNPGFKLSMLTLLIIGYAFMVFYIAILFVMATVGYIKYK